MSLKDKPLFENVFSMNMAVIASIITVIAMALVFFVFAKGNYEKQAREFVKEKQEKIDFQVKQIKDNDENNKLLWTLVDSIWKSPDKSKAFVKKLADAQKLPRCKGKACEGDEARLNVNNKDPRFTKVGWSKYSFKVMYAEKGKNDKTDKFLTIDVDDLLGKSAAEESADGAQDGEESAE
jgi:hypothetical protein